MKHLNTDFKRFILEKLNTEHRKKKEEEIEEVEPDDDIEEPIDDEEPENEYQDDEDELDDDVINELLREWKKIKKNHELHKLYKRRK